ELWKHVKGFVNSGTLRCALQLRLPDAIHNHGRLNSIPDLTAALTLSIPSLNHDRLYLILCYLVYIDLFPPHDIVGPAANTRALCLLHPPPRFHPEDAVPQGELGRPLDAATTLLGAGRREEPVQVGKGGLGEHSRCGTAIMVGELVRALKESGVAAGAVALVNVGGNKGQVAEAIVGAFPHLKCSNLELPHVFVLHDWNDEDCLKVLKKCKEAIAASKRGKVIVVDIVLGSNSADGFANARFNMEMLMFVIGGKERTGEEWKNLIQNAGFSKYEILPIKALESVILLYP
ncbi:hypothetical protein ACLOJK_029674, partial [Asimina triloba]